MGNECRVRHDEERPHALPGHRREGAVELPGPACLQELKLQGDSKFEFLESEKVTLSHSYSDGPEEVFYDEDGAEFRCSTAAAKDALIWGSDTYIGFLVSGQLISIPRCAMWSQWTNIPKRAPSNQSVTPAARSPPRNPRRSSHPEFRAPRSRQKSRRRRRRR